MNGLIDGPPFLIISPIVRMVSLTAKDIVTKSIAESQSDSLGIHYAGMIRLSLPQA